MKKLLIVPLLAFSLGGCANLKNAWDVISSAAVSPTQIIVAGNTFVALENTATNYLVYCKSVKYVPQPCALGNRKPVVKAVRSGRAALNALEPYATQGKAGPAAIYQALIGAVNTLQNSNLAAGG